MLFPESVLLSNVAGNMSTASNVNRACGRSKFMLKSFLITDDSIMLNAFSFGRESNELTFSLRK
jgi:hypothetical protein